MNAFSLKTDTGGAWDWDLALSRYDFLEDTQGDRAAGSSPSLKNKNERFAFSGQISCRKYQVYVKITSRTFE